MHTIEARSKQTFLRNEYAMAGKYNIPIVHSAQLELVGVDLISYTDIKTNDTDINKNKGVHFFIDDYRMENVYYNYDKTIHRLSQYKFLATPDYSLYGEMPKALQIDNVFRNRWCGAYWQSLGLNVVPTISWAGASSFEFCFDGVEKGSPVIVGMIGCKHSKTEFMRGYNAMLERIEPSTIIVFGSPFAEMKGNIIPVDYLSTRKVDRTGRVK
jgi:hypothetical protein